jgi:hypothetical protein
MGVKTMTEQSENTAKKTTTIDKSTPVQDEQRKSKPVQQGELSEQELEKASGGCKGTHFLG